METIRVNMTPCEDVQTIHASQNDGEAREWGFILHNNGDVIDSSEITDQMVFKSYEGGTEQILPENGAVPVTAPFVGDIKYPDATRADQEFLYRQSPTEEDGLAFIKNIKGNTLVWNQLVQNGNFADTSNWRTEYGATISASNNVLSLTPTVQNGRVSQNFTYIANHKLLIMADVKLSSTSGTFDLVSLSAYGIDNRAQTSTQSPISSTNWQKLYVFCYSTSANAKNRFAYTDGRTSDWGTTQIRNFMAFDLTSMFGETKANELFASEQSQVGKGLLEFTSLFPLPYYDYNQGTLIPFSGNGIKTVGKNQVLKVIEVCNIDSTGKLVTDGQGYYDMAVAYVVKGQQYTFQPSHGNEIMGYFLTEPSIGSQTYDKSRITNGTTTFMAQITGYVAIRLNRPETNAQLEYGSTVTDYEPFTESTLSIPLDEFPNGMDGIGNIFDEKTENKTIQRLVHYKVTGEENVDRWVDNTSTVFSNHYGGVIDVPSLVNCMYGGNAIALASKGYQVKFANENKTIYLNSGGKLAIIDDSYTTQSAWLEGIKGLEVVFALRAENYVETSFTTASLVTENVEIPLSNDDGVLIGKCTEQLSSESGFFDGKIKLADDDGECYSNKLQLHVERSPQ